jgi:hypothetical protein
MKVPNLRARLSGILWIEESLMNLNIGHKQHLNFKGEVKGNHGESLSLQKHNWHQEVLMACVDQQSEFQMGLTEQGWNRTNVVLEGTTHLTNWFPIDFPDFFLESWHVWFPHFGGENVLTNHRILGCCVPCVICDEGSFHQNWKQKNMGWANMGLKQHGDWTE